MPLGSGGGVVEIGDGVSLGGIVDGPGSLLIGAGGASLDVGPGVLGALA